MTRDELKALAEAAYKGNVFFSTELMGKDPQLLGMVFLPIALMTQDERTKLAQRKDVFCIYEHVNKALPTSINGYPIFASFHTISKKDYIKLVKIGKAIQGAVKKV